MCFYIWMSELRVFKSKDAEQRKQQMLNALEMLRTEVEKGSIEGFVYGCSTFTHETITGWAGGARYLTAIGLCEEIKINILARTPQE